MARLFFGEYEPANRELSIGTARVVFLNATRLHVPAVLEDLRDNCFDLYCRLETEPLRWWEVRYGRRPTALLCRSLLAWARKWHLEPEWCLDAAVSTMWDWSMLPSSLETLDWQQGEGGWMVPTHEEERRFVFEHAGWEPTYDYRAKIKQEIEQAFKKQLEDYLERIESLVEHRGYVRTKSKTKREHFEWLACFHVAEMSFEEINDKFRPPNGPDRLEHLSDDTKAIRKAVNEPARFISLPLREEAHKPGRRPKNGKR